MATELASAYITLIPSFQGGAAAISKEMGGPAQQAGKAAGSKFGNAFSGSVTSIMSTGAVFGGLSALGAAFNQAVAEADLPGIMQSQFGMTEAAAAESSLIAADLYAQGWGESVGEVGAAVGEIGRQLDQLGQTGDVEALTEQASALANRFGQELTPTITAASQLVKTGLAPNFEAAFDSMTAGFRSGADQSQDLLDTITEYSSQFSKLGIDATTAMGLLNQGLESGARNGDLVADAIKEFSIRAIDGSTTTAEGFAAIGLSAEDMAAQIGAGGEQASAGLQTVLDRLGEMEDPVEREAAAVALFGTQAEDLGQALFALDPSSAADGLGEVAGAAENLAEGASASATQQLTELGRTLKSDLAGSLVAVVPLLSGLFNFLRPLLPFLAPLALGIATLTAAQWAWNVALSANPIGLIVIAIAALVAGLVWLWNNVDGFRNFWVGAWELIKAAASAAYEWVKGAWQSLVDGLGAPIRIAVAEIVGRWSALKEGARAALDWVGDKWSWLVDKIDSAASDIRSFLSGIWETISSGARSAVNGAIGLLNGAIGALNDLISGANKIPNVDIPYIPYVPYLAQGGVAMGPTLAVVGEGAEPEAIVPLSKLDAMLSASSGARDANAGVTIELVAGDRYLLEWLRNVIRTQGGGNVQTALGQGVG